MLGLVFDCSDIAEQPIVQKVLVKSPTLAVPANTREDVLSVARKGWENRTHSEYIGMLIMRHFHGLLVDSNAPIDIQETALNMMLQEQQHANLCIQAAKALGSDGVVGFDLSELQMNRNDEPLDVQLLQMIVNTFAIGEATAFSLLSHSVKMLPESGFRHLLRQILKDEVLHANIGYYLLSMIREKPQSWLKYPGDQWLVELVNSQIDIMRNRDVVEEEEAQLFDTDPQAKAQLMALGIPPSDQFKQVYFAALENDVQKNFERVGISC